MGGQDTALLAHMKSGLTTVCNAWAIRRKDGVEMGFTDHDRALEFDGLDFRPDTGMSAAALQQSTGLSVDNTETFGALSDAAISERDIDAGRYDGAEVRAWLVNWADVEARHLVFRGSIGELRRAGGAFHAELRGISEALNRPMGRVYQKPCTAVLGDGACRVDVSDPAFSVQSVVSAVEENRLLRFEGLGAYQAGWFALGRLEGVGGACDGLSGMIKRDWQDGGQRVIELWHPMRDVLQAGDSVRLVAGCDKRMENCRVKFANLMNYQGFPDIPGDAWLAVLPAQSGALGGGSRRS